jgi:hypothetical protein
MSMYSRNSRGSDRWGAAIAGAILFALPMAGALYRGSFAALAVAADSFARHCALEVP